MQCKVPASYHTCPYKLPAVSVLEIKSNNCLRGYKRLRHSPWRSVLEAPLEGVCDQSGCLDEITHKVLKTSLKHCYEQITQVGGSHAARMRATPSRGYCSPVITTSDLFMDLDQLYKQAQTFLPAMNRTLRQPLLFCCFINKIELNWSE